MKIPNPQRTTKQSEMHMNTGFHTDKTLTYKTTTTTIHFTFTFHNAADAKQ